MKQLKNKNSINTEFFSKQNELEKYAQIGRTAHELFHDLLNPITGFMLYINLIKEDKIDQKEINKHTKQIIESTHRIRRFIKLVQESIVSPNKKEALDLNKNIRDVMLLLYYKAKRNNVSIILLSDKKIKVKIQKIKLYQIIINLLSNAIDSYENVFDDRKRQIVIKTSIYENKIMISFNDNGCGIKDSNINKIFNTNYTNKESGFGLGLKTVEKIVCIEFGGLINVKSKENVGTEFKISLPKNHL